MPFSYNAFLFTVVSLVAVSTCSAQSECYAIHNSTSGKPHLAFIYPNGQVPNNATTSWDLDPGASLQECYVNGTAATAIIGLNSGFMFSGFNPTPVGYALVMGYQPFAATPGTYTIVASNVKPAPAPKPPPPSYSQRTFEKATSFFSETNGTWLMADYDRDGIPDLIYIKTENTGSGQVEIHGAPGSSLYQARFNPVVTVFGQENDGTWSLIDYDHDQVPDLVFIKTGKRNDVVEVHVAPGSLNYKKHTVAIPTGFKNEKDGVWLMADFDGDKIDDLIFLDTSASPYDVLMRVASGASNFQQITDFGTPWGRENDGTWLMTGSNKPDLVFIKTEHTPPGKVEVHLASGKTNYYQRTVETSSVFGNETDGVWLMADYNRDGIPDLVFIKIGMPQQKVEVHVTAGH